MRDIRAEAFFLPGEHGERFCILHRPAEGTANRGSILHVHPFAEEMNKTRRMAALAARALARDGWSVLQLDLSGCGDSGGSFGDAGWREWIADVQAGWTLLRSRFGGAPWLWGTRAGAMLACEAARGIDDASAMLFWQPVTSGGQHLTQFMRLKLAREALGGAADKEVMRTIRDTLGQGRSVEISGYQLSSSLASGLRAAALAPPRGITRVIWLEVSSAEPPSFGPASLGSMEAIKELGIRVDARIVPGPAFWQTVEVEECDALLTATTEALSAA